MHHTTMPTMKWLQSMIRKLQLKRVEKKSVTKADKSKKPATAKQLKPKPVKEKSSKPAPTRKPKAPGQAHVGGVAIRVPVVEATRPLPVVEGKGKATATKEQAAQSLLALHMPKKRSTTDQFIFQRRTPATEEASTGPSAQPQDDTSINTVYDSPSPVDPEIGADTDKTNSGEEDQDGPDTRKSYVALAGLDPEPMHNDFVTTMYPQVHERLKHPDKEHVHEENPLSSTGTLSSMKNQDAYTYGDQFFNDKSTEEDPRKINMETEVDSMVTVLIHQASSSIPTLSTPVIDPSTTKPVSSPAQAPTFIATTETTKTLPLPPQHQSFSVPDLASRVSAPKQPPAPPSSTWETSDTREVPSSFSKQKSVPHSKQPVEDVPITDDVNISDSEDTDTAHLPKIKTRPNWLKHDNALASSYQDPDEYKVLWQTGDISSFINWFCKRIRKKKLSKADLEGPAFKVVRPFHDNNISLQFQMEECHLLLTNQVDLVNPEGSKERRSALSISKLKTTNYLDFRLEELVPSLWIESERDYDISAVHGISHWWFKRKEFYLNRYSAPSDRQTVRYHMRILSLTTRNRMGGRLAANDFEDLYLLHLQGKLNHLFGSDNSTQSTCGLGTFLLDHGWETCSSTLRAIRRSSTLLNRTRMHLIFFSKKITPLFPSHMPIMDNLDHMVKDFKLFKYNPSMESRICSEDDRRRSEDFMEVIERRLKVHIKMEIVSSCSGKDKFITACSYLTNTFEEIMKAQEYVSKLSQL
ncbi:hypothetical protein Tco_0153434 [Tanacetum coccineum]